MLKKLCTVVACALVSPLSSLEIGDTVDFAKDVSVCLRDPSLCDGVLTTESGGVVTAPDIRIQARNIESSRQIIDDKPVFVIRAEGDLMLEYHDQIFTGSLLQYDIQKRHGYLYDGRSVIHPWYVGADCIILLPSGDYRLYKGFLSTSPFWDPEWQICMEDGYITKKYVLTARGVQFKLMRLPLLWLPYLKTPLDWLIDHPLRYRIRWGGEQGFRIGATYKILDWGCFKTFLRTDYRLSRGPGVAIETEYATPDSSEVFLTRNYVARDSSLIDPEERFRYRFQGYYNKCLGFAGTDLNVTYDKISDEDMPNDYSDRDLDLETAQKTQVSVHSQTDYIVANFRTRVRVNPFETVKEDLPVFNFSVHPVTLGWTGIISESRAAFGYHDFKFSNLHPDTQGFNSTRVEFTQSVYRPFRFGSTTLTPEAGGIAIYYGNSMQRDSKWVVLGCFGATLNTQLQRTFDCFKHVIEPYAQYRYLTTPNNSPDQHFIFDLNDGWFRLDTLRIGTRHLLYQKWRHGNIAHRLTLDLYAYCFFDTPTIGSVVPRIYAKTIWDATPYLRYTTMVVYNQQHNLLDELNLCSQWTFSDNLALYAEYRYRSQWYWRRVDPDNFILDSFRSENQILASPLSDKRSTALLHLYWRLQHDLALDVQYHQGWGRTTQPNYHEYQIDLHKTIRSTWHLTFSYQFREDDHRFAIHMKCGLKRPECPGGCPTWSLLE